MLIFLCHYFDSSNIGKSNQTYRPLSAFWADNTVQSSGDDVDDLTLLLYIGTKPEEFRYKLIFLHCLCRDFKFTNYNIVNKIMLTIYSLTFIDFLTC